MPSVMACQIRAKSDGRAGPKAPASATTVPLTPGSQHAQLPVLQQYGEPEVHCGGEPLQLREELERDDVDDAVELLTTEEL